MNTLILGATGTLGQELVKQLLTDDSQMITILSRDELKQSEMKRKFDSDRLKFVLGDIRDFNGIARHFDYQNMVYHVAALKHIDVLEENPEESIKTNVLGTINVSHLCIHHEIPLIFSSTDKAVDPINTYGMCKGLSERILIQNPHAKIFRWGNVIGSRGSVIHYFAKTLREEYTAYITDPRMSRFWIKIEDAVRFMINHSEVGAGPKINIPPMKAARVDRMICSVARVLGIHNYYVKVTEMRPGEKLHEAMHSQHGPEPLSSDTCEQFEDSELDEMVGSVLCPS